MKQDAAIMSTHLPSIYALFQHQLSLRSFSSAAQLCWVQPFIKTQAAAETVFLGTFLHQQTSCLPNDLNCSIVPENAIHSALLLLTFSLQWIEPCCSEAFQCHLAGCQEAAEQAHRRLGARAGDA